MISYRPWHGSRSGGSGCFTLHLESFLSNRFRYLNGDRRAAVTLRFDVAFDDSCKDIHSIERHKLGDGNEEQDSCELRLGI